MPKSNVSKGDGAAKVVVTSASESMAIYEDLPERWRRLVNSLPIPQAVTRIKEVLDERGTEKGYTYLCDLFEAKFPGWQRPTAEDFAIPPAPMDKTERRVRAFRGSKRRAML